VTGESGAGAANYEILYERRARRDLDRLPSADFDRIDPRIWALGENPRPHGVEKLDENKFRIRVGPWRVIYLIDDKARRVIISRVKRRKEDTYRRGL
jgi:mRNA interferase RelE/StbE